MANLKAAIKALRQSQKRAERNRLHFTKIRDLKRHFRKAIEAKKKDEAEKLLKDITVAIDKAAKKNIIKKNTASRKISRLAKQLNRLAK